MPTATNVVIHPSQFPDQVQRELAESLRRRKLNHKFLYDSHKQTEKWLALHEKHSPARTDLNCLEIYDSAYRAAADCVSGGKLRLIGLGCGGGQKDARLLELLGEKARSLEYTPCDVSVPMVLVAQETAKVKVPGLNCHPSVFDLATIDDLPELLALSNERDCARLITFFGMLPNFEPEEISPRLAGLLGPGDFLLLSANLAPGREYVAGVRAILPQYDNELMRDWLLSFLVDLGIEREDGQLHFSIEKGVAGLLRVVAHFHFGRSRRLTVQGEVFEFPEGERFRLFFSYRHTPRLVRGLLAPLKIEVMEQWIADSEEEGVFLCRKAG